VSGVREAPAGPRRTRRVVLAGLGVLAVALGAVVAMNVLDDDAPQECSRTAEAPVGGTVHRIAQGAQLVVGQVTLGFGDLSEDGCTVTTLGDVSSLEVGERVAVAGVPVELLGVERRGGGQAGGAFEARVWVAEQA